jgi:lysozyme family protein
MDTIGYEEKFVIGPGFDKIVDRQLRTQLIDFGANSGPAVAIQKLQLVLGAPQTGVLDADTVTALTALHPDDVCNGLVAARVRMIGQIVSKSPAQLPYLSQWLDRALQFLQ